jgi:hypothetical protein
LRADRRPPLRLRSTAFHKHRHPCLPELSRRLEPPGRSLTSLGPSVPFYCRLGSSGDRAAFPALHSPRLFVGLIGSLSTALFSPRVLRRARQLHWLLHRPSTLPWTRWDASAPCVFFGSFQDLSPSLRGGHSSSCVRALLLTGRPCGHPSCPHANNRRSTFVAAHALVGATKGPGHQFDLMRTAAYFQTETPRRSPDICILRMC